MRKRIVRKGLPDKKIRCKACGEAKPAAEYQWVKKSFGKSNAEVTNWTLDSRSCRSCRSEANRVVNRLRKLHPYPKQNRCQCCGETQTKRLNLDHCYITRTFRGWLCGNCNTGIGRMGDSIAGVRMALVYLLKHTQVMSDRETRWKRWSGETGTETQGLGYGNRKKETEFKPK